MSDIRFHIGFQNILIGQALRGFIEKHPLGRSIQLMPIEEFELSSNTKYKSIAILEVSSACGLLDETITKIHKSYPLVPVIVTTSITPQLSVSCLIEQNVSGLILADCCTEVEVLECISSIMEGKTFYCSVATRKLFDENRNKMIAMQTGISCREKEILQLLANGMKNKEIAVRLNISEATVKTHRRNLMTKLGADDLLALIREACSDGILDLSMLPCCAAGKY